MAPIFTPDCSGAPQLPGLQAWRPKQLGPKPAQSGLFHTGGACCFCTAKTPSPVKRRGIVIWGYYYGNLPRQRSAPDVYPKAGCMHYAATLHALCSRSTSTMQLLYKHYVIALQALCSCYTSTM